MDMPSTGEHLLAIGQFSRLTQLSIRMLRYYDEHGVLHPTHVDPFSGFRYYSPALLVTARQVRQLRDVGLGVAELAACVTALGDTATLRSTLLQHRGRLADDAATVADRIREVDHLITTLEEPAMSITVNHRTLPARTVASLRAVIPCYADEGQLWQRLMPAVFSSGTMPAPDAHAIAVFHDEEYKDSDVDVEIQLSVAAPFADVGDVRCIEVPEQEVATGILNGPYDAIGTVMEAVGSWVPENGYQFAGPMFNIYQVSPQEEQDPAKWVTEVCVPVASQSS
jgi:DNA-binding transcriptional MerR regulator